jgi:phosphate transport system ATP-binding protein
VIEVALREAHTVAAVLPAASPAVSARNLSASFGQTRAIRDVSIELPRHRVSAIIGPSGCGKSTFLRCLNRMHETVSGAHVTGDVRVGGTEIYGRGVSPVAVRRMVGMVFQRPTPFPTMSVRDNVAAGLKLIPRGEQTRVQVDAIVENALKRAALWEEVKDRLKQSAMSLSGGQQQRLCIARALATEPDILLLDEPTASLDPLSTQRIEEMLHELRNEITLVIVTHNMQQAARVSDQTAFFLSGELVEVAETRTMFTNPSDERTEAYITGRFG